jgi:hypothetical protein
MGGFAFLKNALLLELISRDCFSKKKACLPFPCNIEDL